jgi:hypothetical protein
MPRTRIVVTLVAALVLGRPVAGRTASPGVEFGMAIGAAGANLLYTPAKVAVAAVGLLVGSVTGILTGGDVRAAYAIWVPAASGTYLLRPANLDGTEPIAFFGSDYADTPSIASGTAEAGGIYDAQYSR